MRVVYVLMAAAALLLIGSERVSARQVPVEKFGKAMVKKFPNSQLLKLKHTMKKQSAPKRWIGGPKALKMRKRDIKLLEAIRSNDEYALKVFNGWLRNGLTTKHLSRRLERENIAGFKDVIKRYDDFLKTFKF